MIGLKPSSLTGVFGASVGRRCRADASYDVYAAANLPRNAYKFAKPISVITWAAFLAKPR